MANVLFVVASTAALQHPETLRAACRSQVSNEAASRLVVPAALRGQEAPATEVFSYASLDAVFPGSCLGEAFEHFDFRNRLRRDSEADHRSRGWRWDVDDACPRLTRALARAGPRAPTGEKFLATLGSLQLPDLGAKASRGIMAEIGGERRDDSVLDFGGNRTMGPHAWHQDFVGWDQVIIMLGFPTADSRGPTTGVFSHLVKLSHSMADPPVAGYRPEAGIPDHHIIRPVFKRGQEIMLFHDNSVLHSTPDIVYRDAIWIFG